MELSLESFKKIQTDNTIALIPVGALEAHGPNLPFATDIFIAEAFTYLISQKVDSVIMPSVCYSYSGVTKNICGSISIDTTAAALYIESILENLVRLKFNKIIIINIHKDNDSLLKLSISKIHDSKRIPVMYINPYENFSSFNRKIFSKKSNPYKETSLLIASLKIINKKFDFKKINGNAKGQDKPYSIRKLKEIGYIRFDYKSELEHIVSNEGCSISEGMKYLELARDEVLKRLKYLDDYSKYLREDY